MASRSKITAPVSRSARTCSRSRPARASNSARSISSEARITGARDILYEVTEEEPRERFPTGSGGSARRLPPSSTATPVSVSSARW